MQLSRSTINNHGIKNYCKVIMHIVMTVLLLGHTYQFIFEFKYTILYASVYCSLTSNGNECYHNVSTMFDGI